MRPKRHHPLQARLFIWALDLAGASLLLLSWPQVYGETPLDWLRFGTLTVLFILARLQHIKTADHNSEYGWDMAVEFAALLTLGIPLYGAMLVIWMVSEVVRRLAIRHPEPFLGPDFNAAQRLLAAFLAHQFLEGLAQLNPLQPDPPRLWELAVLPLAAFVYVFMQALFVGCLISLDRRVRLRRAGTLALENLAGDLTMAITGSFIGRVFRSGDWGAVFLMLGPSMLMHHVVRKLQDSRQAHRDAKTGLYNYRYFMQALQRSVRPGRPCALIFADLDHLKHINDSLGHMAGDRALEAVGRVLHEQCMDDEVAARWGGEEFVLLLPGCGKEAAVQVAERMRARIEAAPVAWEDHRFHITVSMGVAACPGDAGAAAGLVQAADVALYRAKAGGRNRVVGFERGPLEHGRTAAPS